MTRLTIEVQTEKDIILIEMMYILQTGYTKEGAEELKKLMAENMLRDLEMFPKGTSWHVATAALGDSELFEALAAFAADNDVLAMSKLRIAIVKRNEVVLAAKG
jgi:hypothetical protein